jgi:hypothetical protein
VSRLVIPAEEALVCLGKPQVRTCGYLGAPFRVLVRRHLESFERDLYRSKLGFVLIFDRERVRDVLAVRLTRVAGQCCLPFMLRPKHLVNIAARAWRVHMPKLVLRSGSTLNRSPHAAIGLM